MSAFETAPTDNTPAAVADVLAEFGRLAESYGTTDRRNGTNAHDFGQRAEQAAGVVVRARQKGRLSWRHVLAEQYWAVLAETDRAALRQQLVRLAAHTLLWVVALDRRTAQTTQPQFASLSSARETAS